MHDLLLIGTLTQAVELCGTSLRLDSGQRVSLLPADNLPADSQFKYYARPLAGVWPDRVGRGPNDSIAVTAEDVVLDHPGVEATDTLAIVPHVCPQCGYTADLYRGNVFCSDCGHRMVVAHDKCDDCARDADNCSVAD